MVISYLFLKFATKVKVNQIIYIMKRSTHFYAFTFALLLVSTLAHATSIETINDRSSNCFPFTLAICLIFPPVSYTAGKKFPKLRLIDQQQGRLGAGRAGHHVLQELLMAGGVDDDVLALLGLEPDRSAPGPGWPSAGRASSASAREAPRRPQSCRR